jgi:predicted nucleic acid-binding protein
VTYLLDISVLLAWLWDKHEHHRRVLAWEPGKSIAICPLTELGFLRISTSPAFGATMQQAREILQDWLRQRQPQFIPCDVRALDGAIAPTSGKTSDFYFGNLASSHSMQWATLDEHSGQTAAFVIPAPAGNAPTMPHTS